MAAPILQENQTVDTFHMMSFNLISDALNKNGYLFIRECDMAMEALEKVAELQVSRIAKDTLTPKKINRENPGAWSNLYSDKEFPPHTDCAYQSSPPKYIALHCISNENSDRPTYILNYHAIPAEARNKLSRVLWKMRHAEYSGALRLFRKSPTHRQEILRYDPTCMTPYFKKDLWAIDLVNLLYQRLAQKIIWSEGSLLVFDNWRCLHGRGVNSPFQNGAENRIIERHSAYI